MLRFHGDDLLLLRKKIAEPGRYYAAQRTIVVRSGLLIEEERRVLWHELRHHARGDRACDTTNADERIVERQAAEDAMPWVSIVAAWEIATDLDEMADLMKLPIEWVHTRLLALHPGLKAQLRIKV